VTTGAAPIPTTLIGVIGCGQARQLDDGRFVATVLSAAQTIAGRGPRVDSVFVRAAPGTSPAHLLATLRQAVGDHALVTSPQQRVKLAKRSLLPVQQGMLMAISLAFVVAGFLVFNTMSMAALERRRELATLRAIGGRRRSLLIGFLAEAAMLGLVGSALGAVAGIWVARGALTQVPTIFLDLLGVRPSFVLPATAIPAGIMVGTVATLVAAFVPARAAVRVPPVDAMRPEGILEAAATEQAVRPLILAIGAAMFIGGTVVTVAGRGNVTVTGFGGITIGMVVATFGVSGLLATAIARLAGTAGATGRLAGAAIERAPRRVWATTTAVIVAVGIVIALGGVIRNQGDTFAADFAPLGHTDLFVQSATPDTIPVQPRVPFDWQQRLAAIPGVARVVANQAAYMPFGDEQLVVEGMGAGTNAPVYRKAGDAAAAAVSRGDGALLTKGWAAQHHLRVGDTLHLSTPAGPQQTRVAAIVDLPVVVQGMIGIDADRFNRWFGRNAYSSLEVFEAPGADRAAVRRAVDALAATSPVLMHVFTGKEILAGSRQSLRQSTAIFNAMVWVVVAATALALLNTLAISVVERRRELGILRAVGTSRKVVRRMVVVEAAAIALAGFLIGAFLGLIQHRAGVAAVGGLTGFTVRYRFAVVPIVTAAIAAVVMAIAGSVGPAWRAGQVDVIEAIGYE
jgi:putative ABC transport system permease protein